MCFSVNLINFTGQNGQAHSKNSTNNGTILTQLHLCGQNEEEQKNYSLR